jgi:hypothetical protein
MDEHGFWLDMELGDVMQVCWCPWGSVVLCGPLALPGHSVARAAVVFQAEHGLTVAGSGLLGLEWVGGGGSGRWCGCRGCGWGQACGVTQFLKFVSFLDPLLRREKGV